ncbi:MAG TPA: thiamine diphosphokinase [Anaerolineales bacterium]|nr:thiamine diphosphokinase [Anaerolineales bacterium]
MRAIIFANGIITSSPEAYSAVNPGDFLIAANGGAQNCLALGFTPEIVIGDLDSLTAEQKNTLESQGTQFLVYPRAKDQTDLELALGIAVSRGVEQVILLGLLGGRLDQTLANLLLVSRSEWLSADLVIIDGPDTAHFLHGPDQITLEALSGDIVSLVPLSEVVTGVTTQGLRWPLAAAQLLFGSTLGVSNEIVAAQAQVEILTGKLFVIHRKIGPR